MENINLCKILKGYEGKTFYSPLIGETVILGALNIEEESIEIYSIDEDNYIYLYPDGTYSRGGECMLFPSKDQRDWNKWIEEEYKSKVFKTWSELVKSGYSKGYDLGRNDLDDILVEFEEFDYRSYSNNVTPIEKSALALLKIHQLIEVGYGGNVTDEEWKNPYLAKYEIIPDTAHKNKLCIRQTGFVKTIIAFHTREQAEEFLKYPENVQLLKDYFMI